MFESVLYFHLEHCRVASEDSVAQTVLLVLYVTCFEVALFRLFTRVLLRLQLQLQCTRSEKLCQRCVLGGEKVRTRFLAAVRNPALRKVTVTMVKHEAVESLCLEIFITLVRQI